MNLPRGYISYSQINTYQTCPRKYYYAYVEEREVPLNEKILLGIAFHSTLEDFFKKKIKNKSVKKTSIIKSFKKHFTTIQKENEVIWNRNREDVENRGIRFLDYFMMHLAPDINPLMVEKKLQVELEDLDVTLKGIIDLVEKDYAITDFKTTASKWSNSRMKRSYLQMVIYRYLFEKSFETPNPELKLKILYSSNKNKIGHQEVVLTPDDIHLEKMFEIIRYVVDNIRKEIFYRNQSYVCGFCDFKPICFSPNK
jgi:CRISPR/Cas system-associated exonuclease Cas4 (RecB family)